MESGLIYVCKVNLLYRGAKMELDKTTRDIMLLDIYGGLLTERQKKPYNSSS